MRTLAPFALAAAFALPPAAVQDIPLAAEVVELPVPWKAGAKLAIELAKTRDDWKAGKLTLSTESLTSIEIEVLAQDEQGFVCRWTYGKTRVVPKGIGPVDAMAERLARLNEGFVVDLRADPSGTITGFEDEDRARSLLADQIARLRFVIGEEVLGLEERQSAFAALDAVHESLDGPGLGTMLLKEPMLMTFWCGGSYEPGTKREWEDVLPNPFGGEPVPADASLSARLTGDGARLELEFRQAPDPEKSKALVEAFLKSTMEKTGKSAAELGPLPSIDIQDEAHYVVDRSDGMIRSMRWSRTTTTGDRKRVDGFRIELRAPAAK